MYRNYMYSPISPALPYHLYLNIGYFSKGGYHSVRYHLSKASLVVPTYEHYLPKWDLESMKEIIKRCWNFFKNNISWDISNRAHCSMENFYNFLHPKYGCTVKLMMNAWMWIANFHNCRVICISKICFLSKRGYTVVELMQNIFLKNLKIWFLKYRF